MLKSDLWPKKACKCVFLNDVFKNHKKPKPYPGFTANALSVGGTEQGMLFLNIVMTKNENHSGINIT
jgi:hypothetical protein